MLLKVRTKSKTFNRSWFYFLKWEIKDANIRPLHSDQASIEESKNAHSTCQSKIFSHGEYFLDKNCVEKVNKTESEAYFSLENSIPYETVQSMSEKLDKGIAVIIRIEEPLHKYISLARLSNQGIMNPKGKCSLTQLCKYYTRSSQFEFVYSRVIKAETFPLF